MFTEAKRLAAPDLTGKLKDNGKSLSCYKNVNFTQLLSIEERSEMTPTHIFINEDSTA